MNYFIISQARSGTAWLANALTWGNSFCYHEGIYGYDSMDDYANMLKRNAAKFVGDSDTALVLMLPWLYAMFPDAKYIFINRKESDIRKSLLRIGLSSYILASAGSSLKWGINNIDGMVIEFEDLFTDTERIWDYIGLPDYPKERFEMLRDMKVDNSDKFLNMAPINFTKLMQSAA